MANEYKTHSFKKDWHDKVTAFIDEREDLAFDSPKYFIKFCVNKYIDEKHSEQEKIDKGVELLEERLEEYGDIEK